MNYSKIFNVDFRKLTVLLTPVFWRKLRFINFMYVLIEPVVVLKRDFDKFRGKSIYKVTHNGQVGLLEKVLNDSFDVEERRIRIEDSGLKDPLFIYTKNENKPVFLGRKFVYSKSELGDQSVDFFVIFPVELKPIGATDLANVEAQIKAKTNEYRLASKRYKILWT